MLTIGNIKLNSNLILAPLAGYTDLPFRLTARHASPNSLALTYTDLICPHALIKQTPQSKYLTLTSPLDSPLALQLFSSDPDLITAAAKQAVDLGAQIIDINMGCPADKVTKTNAGSKLLTNPDLAVKIAEQIINTLSHYSPNTPVTAKLRLAYHNNQLTAPALARRLVNVGIAAITIHGRTAQQKFLGKVNLDAIAQTVDAVHEASNNKIPCIANGDIKTPFDAKTMLTKTNADALMIGRAALSAPWIFRDTHHYLTTGKLPTQLTLTQRVDIIKYHFNTLLKYTTPHRALSTIKQRFSTYAIHLAPCKPLKIQIQSLTTPNHFITALDSFLENHPAPHSIPLTWQQRATQLHHANQTL